MSTLPPMPTLVPTITPTPVPLPEVCLLTDFAGDTALCSGLTHYEISLTIDPSLARVTGQQEVLYTNLEDKTLKDIYLRLFPNTPNYGGTMTVTNIFVGGRAVTPVAELQASALRLPLESFLRAGESVTLTMDFSVGVPATRAAGHGLFSYVDGVMALPDVYPFIPVYDDEGWNVEIAPTHSDDVYADVASYDVTISVPDEFAVITSGACSRPWDGTWACEAAPVREFALVLGRDYEQANRMVGDVVVNSYYYPGHEVGGSLALDVADRALSIFSNLFGPYPYSELDVVETPNYLGGMEYPGLVVLEDSLYPTGSRVEWLTAHEVAHQWWFGLVGSDQVDEPWLDEALTQYSTFLYYEAVYGPERARSVLNAEFVHTHRELVRSGLDLPVGLPASAYSSALYWQVVYDKGALYFHNLREAIGDDAFFEVLQVYFRDNRYSIATPEDWLDAVEKVTGDRHLGIYRTWILGSSDGEE
ncbi:MAG: M1 family metallopeptidase [Anaerolineae bacterium]|nr:M1 family metallopeptidase [Anaerolineae bacterium]